MYDGARDLTDGGSACGCCTRLMEINKDNIPCPVNKHEIKTIYSLSYSIYTTIQCFSLFQSLLCCVFSEGFCSVRPSG